MNNENNSLKFKEFITIKSHIFIRFKNDILIFILIIIEEKIKALSNKLLRRSDCFLLGAKNEIIICIIKGRIYFLLFFIYLSKGSIIIIIIIIINNLIINKKKIPQRNILCFFYNNHHIHFHY